MPKGHSKSGYAKDIMPELLSTDEKEGRSVPVATAKGGVAGSSASKKHAKNVEMVSADEADKRMRARMRGELPPLSQDPTQYEDVRMELNDSSNEVPGSTEDFVSPGEELSSAGMAELAKALKSLNLQSAPVEVQSPQIKQLPKVMVANEAPIKSAVQSYLDSRARVNLQVENAGSYSIPAIDVINAGFGVMVLLPAGENDAVFIPNAGTAVDITFKNETYQCYFPGVTGEIPDLKILVMSFINKQ